MSWEAAAIPTAAIPTNIDQPQPSVFQVEVHVKVGNTAPLNARISGTELSRNELGLM